MDSKINKSLMFLRDDLVRLYQECNDIEIFRQNVLDMRNEVIRMSLENEIAVREAKQWEKKYKKLKDELTNIVGGLNK